ncbi:hypothetical protein [Staphylothermus hellenicus]|uniref:Uncharacterized protein n=1 Tax=Staphylothermus hellenicus (strain DSM 12710 / JCM 10830 / BK20S6-10-b1 / P8) TaxID=591019 RepID=D7DBI4_STAHD|nr:hypothetical protein [Staphylothermus hellenicus]ADI31531.1 hypothetical protein Shell_0400 [Staphylothermus hellenicus DSM 12710]
MNILDPESFYLASIFIREAIYRSLSRYRVRRGIHGYLVKLLMPSIDDKVLVYNMKWFVTGMMSGLFIGLWIPIVSYGSNLVGLPSISKAFIASYLIMAMLISIVIILDLIYQVTASIRDLGITKPIEYMPIKYESIEKAASYSIIVGGGLSLLLGTGLSIGIMASIVLKSFPPMIMMPLGFASLVFLVYPLTIIIYSRIKPGTNSLVSLAIYLFVIITVLSFYVYFMGLGSRYMVLSVIRDYMFIFPIPYVYASINGFDPESTLYCLLYFVIGLVSSLYIPRKYGVKIIWFQRKSYGNSKRILSRSKIITLGLKDLYLLIRDHTRQKQFYGELAAVLTPLYIPLFNPAVQSFLKALNSVSSIVLIGLYGLIAYILAVITVPILIFVEADRNKLLYAYPLSREEVVLGKTIASTILFFPIPFISLIIVSFLISWLHGLIVFYTFISYWVSGAYLSNSLILRFLWGRLDAWTELSLGIVRRLLLLFILSIPLMFFTPLILFFFVFKPQIALYLLLLSPLPINIYVGIRTLTT